MQKTWIITKLAIPAIFSTFTMYFQEMINIYYVSQLGDVELLSAVGLGNIILNSLIISTIYAFNSVIETKISQTAGKGDLEGCGVYLNRGLFVNLIVFIFTLPFIFQSENILLALGQQPKVCEYTQQFLVYLIPTIYIHGITDLKRKFLSSLQYNLIPMIAFVTSVAFHPYWTWYFVCKCKLGI